jgi:hypothetical protein
MAKIIIAGFDDSHDGRGGLVFGIVGMSYDILGGTLREVECTQELVDFDVPNALLETDQYRLFVEQHFATEANLDLPASAPSKTRLFLVIRNRLRVPRTIVEVAMKSICDQLKTNWVDAGSSIDLSATQALESIVE